MIRTRHDRSAEHAKAPAGDRRSPTCRNRRIDPGLNARDGQTLAARVAVLLLAMITGAAAQEPALDVQWNPVTGNVELAAVGSSPPAASHRLDFSSGLGPWYPIAASAALPLLYADTEARYRPRGIYRVRSTPVAGITPHSSWKNGITLPGDPFQSDPILTGFGQEEIRWIKFTILLDNLPAVYFQDSAPYPFHFNFANERLDPFLGIGLDDYNAVTLFPPGQEMVLGAVLFAPNRGEFAVEFVGQDAYPPEMLRFLFELVDASVSRPGDWTGFYFPTFEQAPSAAVNQPFFSRHGIPLGSIARWQNGDACYSPGWALGRLVFVPAGEIDAAFLGGDLLPTDILMTDGVPAEVPFVAGIISTAPGTPNSHVAILARTYGVPFVYLSSAPAVDDALALVGEEIVLRGSSQFSGACRIDVFEALGVSGSYRQEILDLKSPPAIELTPKATSGSISMAVDTAALSDLRFIGGKAANFSLLRQTIPQNSPPAIAFTFDLWDAYLSQPLPGGGTLEGEIASRLAPYTWPPDIAAIDAELNAIRDLIKDTADFSPAQQGAILAALQGAGFDPMKKIRFRSSTNVEDAGAFVGAGLYDSFSGCLQDELDGDDLGPSHCDPTKADERGVFRAMRKVYASFYNLNAYLERLRRGVDEDQVGMAMLVHHSFPDEIEAANGVITGMYREFSTSQSLNGEIVTQLGAVSVTNPDGNSIPELVTASCFRANTGGGGCSVSHQERSSLLPLGIFSVMDWEDDYREFIEYAADVAEAYATATGRDSFHLEFEFKKLTDDSLVIKQVREVPEPDASGATNAALVNRPVTVEVFQGEAADLFSNHNLKSLFAIETASRWLDPSDLNSSFLTGSDWSHQNDGVRGQKPGPISTWNDAAFEVRDIFGSDFAVESWTEPSFAGGSTDFEFRIQLPTASSFAIGPIRVAADLRTELHATFSVPQMTTDFSGVFSTTTSQVAILVPSVTDQPLPAGSLPQARSHTAESGAAIAINFHWPPAPTGPVAGYTAPLQKWDTTTITGLTSQPIVLQGYFSQTYRPGHHNFTEEFLFEPRLEEGISPVILSELQSLNIKQIYVEIGFSTPEFKAIGFDWKVRDL